MDDLISRQQAINALRAMQTYKLFAGDDMLLIDQAEAQTELMVLPSAQPEHKTGHWIPVTNGRGGHQCDRCGCYAPSYQSGTEWLSNFCPECNADMRGDKDEIN